MRRAREGRPIKERLSARALESLSEAADQGSSKMATIEAWRRRQKRADAESLAADAARLTGGKKVGMKEAAGIVRQTMLESFGIDLDKEDGPSPPYSESDPTGARTPKPPSDPRARFVPKEIAELLRDFCRLGDLHPPKRDAPESRLPSDYQQSTPFPSTGTKIFSAQVDPVPPRQAAATTSVDRATSSPPAPPAELPPSLPPSWQAPDHFVPRPNNDADEDSDEVYSLAPQDPAEAAFAEASRRRGHSPPKLSAEEKAERRARRKDGRPIDSTGAERDVAWYKMQEVSSSLLLIVELPLIFFFTVHQGACSTDFSPAERWQRILHLGGRLHAQRDRPPQREPWLDANASTRSRSGMGLLEIARFGWVSHSGHKFVAESELTSFPRSS